jgi:hypothetical protein
VDTKPDEMKMLKVIQINSQHKRVAGDALCRELIENDIDVALIQEPYLSKTTSRIPSLPSSYCQYSTEDKKQTRSCVIIKKAISHYPLKQFFSNVMIPVVIRTNCDKAMNAISYVFENFCVSHKISQKKCIIGSDTNCHCCLVGYNKSNSRGLEWEDFIATNEMFVHNISKIPTFLNSRGFSSTIIPHHFYHNRL